MTELEKKIADLSDRASMLEFGTYEQWQKAQSIWGEVKKLDHGRKGWVVELYYIDPIYSNKPFFLTSNSINCFSDDPTYFESEEEARSYLEAADAGDRSRYHIEIRYQEGRE